MDEFALAGAGGTDDLAGLRLRVSRPRPDTVRLAVRGEIDVSNASQLRAGVQQAVDADGADALEVDLAGVPMVDSTGVGALVACRAAVQRAGLRFAVVGPRPVVYRILQVVGLLEALNVSRAPSLPSSSSPAPPDGPGGGEGGVSAAGG